MERTAADGWLYAIVLLIMSIGIANLYSIEGFPPFGWKYAYVRQTAWALLAIGVMIVASLTEGQLWRYLSYLLYASGIGIMLLTALIAREVKGARAWLEIGGFRFQPSEFMKVATALTLAAFMSRYDFRWSRLREAAGALVIIFLPALLTLLQKDTGTTLTYAGLLAGCYRGGLAAWVIVIPLALGVLAFLTLLMPWYYLALGIGLVGTASYLLLFRRQKLLLHLLIIGGLILWLAGAGTLYRYVLAPHQKQRVQALLDPYSDPLGAGWNTIQARLAVVAGGFSGKGYGKGLQSKLDFIPQRHTDFAFCGIAEEWGWLGSALFLGLYAVFLLRIAHLAENSNSDFTLYYGYALAGVLWIHWVIDVSMIVGFFPVVGIPLVFISYGGSSWIAVAWGIGMLQSLYRERRMRLFG
ncbi:MAG: rod shape-determining protein RodA [Bacteroidia bacterium]|nr:rod shape-determining protein RodA [Bacteroidia bacterium]MDW8236085.1 FtsW/RodA/SpoVE family cell cycle protein [Bacteroidia bacterium]